MSCDPPDNYLQNWDDLGMTEYQALSRSTAIYPDAGNNIIYPTLGLAGESGEVAEKVKKIIRDKGGVIDEEAREALCNEIGDVLWYCAQLATELGMRLSDVAHGNLHKLQSRKARGRLQGSGDGR